MEAQRVRLGELLVRAGLISRQQLEETLALQKRDGRRLGTLLVESGLVSEAQVTQILSQQLSVPWVSLHHIDFSEQLLRLVPREVVERYCLVPIYVRRVRGLGDALYVAMDDPTNTDALEEVARHAGLHVRAMIAPPEAIRTAIRDNYGLEIPADFGSGVAHPRPEELRVEPRRPETPVRSKKPSIDEDADTGVHWRRKLVSGTSPTERGRRDTERTGLTSDVDELLAAHGDDDVDTLLASDVSEIDALLATEAHELRPVDEGIVTETTGQLSADDPDVIEIPATPVDTALGRQQALRPRQPPSLAEDAAEPLPLSRRSSRPPLKPQPSGGTQERAPRPAAPAPRTPAASAPSSGRSPDAGPHSGPRAAAPSPAASRPPGTKPRLPSSRPPKPPPSRSLGSPQSGPPRPSSSTPPSPRPPPSSPAPPSSRPPPSSRAPSISRPTESAREPRSSVPRGVSVTLLDGTTISLPGGRGVPPSREPDAASVRDVVAALRATARGADVREALGQHPRWEQMFAALLAILVRKGLLTDREFLDELEKS